MIALWLGSDSSGLSRHNSGCLCNIIHVASLRHRGRIDGAARLTSSCRRCLRQTRSVCARERNGIQFSNSQHASSPGTVIASASEAIHRATKSWIASSRSLSSGAHSRDPLAPLRKRFVFVAGNDERHPRSAPIEFQTAMTTHNTASRSRRRFRASFGLLVPPSPIRGRRECRAPDAPDSRVCDGRK
jgi:hypothetical protein